MDKFRRHAVEHFPLILGEVVAALFQGVVPVLPGGTSDDDDGGLRGLRGFFHRRFLQLHLRVAEGPVAPPAVVHGVFTNPVGIAGGKLGIELLPCVFQALDEVDAPGRVHVASAAVAHIEPVKLAAAEDRRLLILFQWQRPVVFEQHARLRSCLTDQIRKAGGIPALSIRGVFLLHEARTHMPVDRALNDPSDRFRNQIHMCLLKASQPSVKAQARFRSVRPAGCRAAGYRRRPPRGPAPSCTAPPNGSATRCRR